MKEDIAIRRATKEDHQNILKIASNLSGWFDDDAIKRAIPADLLFNQVIVAQIQNQIVGFLVYSSFEGNVYIGWLGIDKPFQDQGVGTLLLDHLEKELISLGINKIKVETLAETIEYEPYVKTRAFYEKNGFTKGEIRPIVSADGEKIGIGHLSQESVTTRSKMANIFLTSSLQTVAAHLAKHIDKSVKKFLFVTTASELEKGAKEWLNLDRNSMNDLGYLLEDYTVTGRTKEQIREKLAEVDGVIMAGGNTIYFLQQIQKSDAIDLFRQFAADGKCYIGSSAGSCVAGPDVYAIREDFEMEEASGMKDFKGLNITDIVVQPHWGSDSFKEPYMNEIMRHSYTTEYKMILLSDNQYVIAEGKNIQIIDINKD